MKRLLAFILAAIMLIAALCVPSFAVPAWSGDASGDGKINARDVILMMRHIVGFDVDLAPTADYDSDGTVNARDVTLTMKYLVGCPVLTDSLLEAKYGVSEPVFEIPDPVTDKEVSGADFGFDPAADDNSAAFNSAAAYLSENPGTKLTLEKGVYRMGGAAVTLDGVKDCVIDGGGAHFIYDTARYFFVNGCEGLKFCDLTVEWDWDTHPLASIVRIGNVAKNADGSSTLDFEFILEEDASYALNEKWDSMMQVDPETYAMSTAVPGGDYFDTESKIMQKTQISANVIRATFARGYSLPKQGDTVIVRHFNYGPWVFNVTGRSSGVIFEDVNLYGNPGQGIAAKDLSDHIRLTRVKITPDPESEKKRYISTTADSIDIGEMSGYVIVEDCEFSFSGDDAIAVNDSMGVVKDVYENEVTMYTSGASSFRVGDSVEFRKANDFAPVGITATITDKYADGKDVVLVLDRDFEDVVEEDDFVLNLSHTTGNIIIRNCYFHENRARAIILGSENCVIENCRFYRTQQQAIKISVDLVRDMWIIGKGSSNVIVRNNTFEKCNLLHNKNGECIYFEPASAFNSNGLIDGECFVNVLVSGNRFIDCPGLAIKVMSVRNLTIYKNTVELAKREFDGLSLVSGGQIKVLGQHYDGSTIIGNTWITSDITPDDYEPIRINPSKISTVTVGVNTVE